MLAAACCLQGGRAAGPDGIPAEVVKVAVASQPDCVLNVFNSLFKTGKFPARWKIGRLALIPKASEGAIKKVRPICILNAVGKLYERLIKGRLQKHVDTAEALDDAQFGFRPKLCTVDAIRRVMQLAEFANSGSARSRDWCVLITLDVKNAFNSLRWTSIVNALEETGTPQHLINIVKQYLTDRWLYTDAGPLRVSSGVPQGSVLGPLLWNISYNGVLRLMVGDSVKMVAFADDLAVVSWARTICELQKQTDNALETINKWFSSTGLSLATHKTEAVLLCGGRRIVEQVVFRLGKDRIVPKESLRYLGVRLPD